MQDKAEMNNVIANFLAQWDAAFVELAIFGTSKPDRIAELANDFCQKNLGSAVKEFLFYESSQGAVFGLCLSDDRRVVVKAHQPTRSLDFLHAVYNVQHHLATHGFPCPTPILGPTPLGRGYTIVEELVDTGVYADAHQPSIRRVMAEKLYQLVDLTRGLASIPGLQSGMLNIFATGSLWPTPHSRIFDFEATAAGSEWIDDYARRAKQALSNSVGETVIGHTDWSVKHFRFVDGKASVIYDWDSLALEKEPVIVGDAARGFTMTWHLDVPLAPTPDEARAFIAEYEAVRGSAFTKAEWATIAAAATFAIAYSARCENCLDAEATTFPEGSYREALSRYGEVFLNL
ncbi:MAG: hypothetical protein E6I32_00610 [Chloroflexi bacterium]|nr:MAG: hypothetical protein E6I32_00610 [Chloroflexota bacterium]